ncbi:MAG: haloacid dehalogenase-like hydrolase [Candidatus Promineifilaceae bacterium]|nr:haloacid dehalogenase-like hydrolase [Candidatus Promineifilaceae bacterium]
MYLLLFDIDGTLIHSNRAGRLTLQRTLEELFETAGPIDDYSMAGKTDPMIISDLLQAAGIARREVENRMDEIYERMAAHGPTLFAERGIRPCSGVPELLAALRARDDVVLGLVTGNIHTTAPLKLAAAGIDPDQFLVGAFGSDASDRNLLPALAMERAGTLHEWLFEGQHTVVIGDTPADILCARAAGATAVAVASGGYSAKTLAQYSPDHLLQDLTDTNAVLDILLATERETHNGY